jgi:S1-C subfamily serine protease
MGDTLKPIPNPDSGRFTALSPIIRVLIKYVGLFLFVIISASAGIFLYQTLYPSPIPLSESELNSSIEQVMASATPPPAISSQVYQVVIPSIVYIQTQQEGESEEDDFGVGSGVVINAGGEILTALHVVAGADEIKVLFADGSNSKAEIIASEPKNDIAVLRPSQLPGIIIPATMGSSGAMRIGDEAFAIGNPLGLAASMSAGVISGFDRSIPLNDKGQRLEGLIQFDTAVNPGNSGGPLLNRQGQVIGIVTALANPSEQGYFIGIGFAVPIGVAVATAGGPEY